MNCLSGYQLVARELAEKRPTLECLDKDVFSNGGPLPKSLIEISGASNTGKSILLNQLIARCLPPTYFGGKYADVIFIDLGHKFSLPHFLNYTKRVICESGEKCSSEECDAAVEKCLDSVTTLDCYSSEEFDLAFDVVEDILWENDNVALLAVDTLDAFYWYDVHEKVVSMNTHYEKLIVRLRKMCETHNICCAYTVDSKYVANDTINIVPTAPKTDINYKIELSMLMDGTRRLNEHIISIADDGIHFADIKRIEQVPVDYVALAET